MRSSLLSSSVILVSSALPTSALTICCTAARVATPSLRCVSRRTFDLAALSELVEGWVSQEMNAHGLRVRVRASTRRELVRQCSESNGPTCPSRP